MEAYVIQGLDRGEGRLKGLANEYDLRLRELRDEDEDSPRIAAIERDREELRNLDSFALPIVTELDDWRRQRSWGEWLAVFEALVPRVLRQPTRVLRVLAEMAPLGAIGPVNLREVREVLTPRLLTLTHEPPRRRHGRVFVGTPSSARGRAFRVVFVPGLAERVFPQRLREDALLLDRRRRLVDPRLPMADAPGRRRAAAAAPRGRRGGRAGASVVSTRRESANRVRACRRSTCSTSARRHRRDPALRDAVRERAHAAGGAWLAWPAPADPDRAIDVSEHDLRAAAAAAGQPIGKRPGPRALSVQLNRVAAPIGHGALGAWQPKWHTADGLIRVAPDTAPALAAQRLTARARTRCRRCSGSPPARTSSICRRSCASRRARRRRRCSCSIR